MASIRDNVRPLTDPPPPVVECKRKDCAFAREFQIILELVSQSWSLIKKFSGRFFPFMWD